MLSQPYLMDEVIRDILNIYFLKLYQNSLNE